MIVWDWGTWEPEETDDPGRRCAQGRAEVRPARGEAAGPVRDRADAHRRRAARTQWLLIHKRDEFADPDWDVDALPRSVKSGRTNDEVKAGAPAIWDSDAPAARGRDRPRRRRRGADARVRPADARDAGRPAVQRPRLAVRAEAGRLSRRGGRPGRAPSSSGRATSRTPRATSRSWRRRSRPGSTRRDAIVDGEVVALDEDGASRTSACSRTCAGMKGFAAHRGERRWEEGESDPSASARRARPRGRSSTSSSTCCTTRVARWSTCRSRSARSCSGAAARPPQVRYLSHVDEDGEDFHAAAGERGLEGIVAKLRRSRYEPGRRSRSWLKLKIRREQELVVIGYEPGKGTHKDLGALLVAVNGRVTTALRRRGRQRDRHADERRSAARRWTDWRRTSPPATGVPRMPGARWAEPRIVIRAEFTEWTTDDLLRQAAFKGIEPDRDPPTVLRERAVRRQAIERGRAADDAQRLPAAGEAKAPPARGHRVAGGERRRAQRPPPGAVRTAPGCDSRSATSARGRAEPSPAWATRRRRRRRTNWPHSTR